MSANASKSATRCLNADGGRISQPKLGQIAHVGGVLKSSRPADFKTDSGFENCPRFVGVIEQNKIKRTYFNQCITLFILVAAFRFEMK